MAPLSAPGHSLTEHMESVITEPFITCACGWRIPFGGEATTWDDLDPDSASLDSMQGSMDDMRIAAVRHVLTARSLES